MATSALASILASAKKGIAAVEESKKKSTAGAGGYTVSPASSSSSGSTSAAKNTSSSGGTSALSALQRIDNTAGTGTYQGGMVTGVDDYGKVDYSARFANLYSNPDTSWEQLQSVYDQRLGKLQTLGGSSEYSGYSANDETQQAMYDAIQARKNQQAAQQAAQRWQVQTPEVQQATDYSEYIKQLQAAAQEKSLAELKAAYDKNVNAINAAQGQIAPQYEDARNQTAGQAALAKKNWQEAASATGLNSGAAGQAALAQSVALQNNLNSLNRQESADLATLEAQLAQTETDYNNAIAQAQANGDYELAAQLYQEKVRVDEENRAAIATAFQQQLQAMQFNYGVSQDALTQQNYEKEYADQLAQQALKNQLTQQDLEASQAETDYNKLVSLAETAASAGNFGYYAALGLDQDTISQLESLWQSNRELAVQQARAEIANKLKSGTTGSGGVTTPTTSTMTLTVAQNMAKQGQFTDEVLDTLRKAGYNDQYIMSTYGWSGPTAESTGVITSAAQLGPVALGFAEQAAKSYSVDNRKSIEASMYQAYLEGRITPEEYNFLADAIGA